jgi:isoleucyl-tRNA synthetase
VVKPDEVIAAVGVDTARWYFYTVNDPGDPKNFSMREVRERLTGFMGTLQNCIRFWELYTNAPEARNFSHGDQPKHLLDRWVMSRLHRLIADATKAMDAYDLTAAARGIERFVVDDLSQWWLRRSRKRSESLGLLRHILLEVDKLLAPFIPFTAEDMHVRLHAGATPSTISVHLHDWAVADQSLVSDDLEVQMAQVRQFITTGLAIRKDQGIKVRQPLASMTVPLAKPLPDDLADLMREELNVKQLIYDAALPVALDTTIGSELRAEGYAREIMRAIQDMRKEAGLSVGDKASCQWESGSDDIISAIGVHQEMIVRETGLAQFVQGSLVGDYAIKKDLELAPGMLLSIGLRK